ncbi:hypothetical protein HMPREF1584_00281 [Gardnerella vaginalis JCP8481A]|nr:hypothetical protein HMPREF1585_00280 [Gardnerella vaginalis JCP8481B]EPI44223.1 hypothetical protein HMPREF1584_00281 [Gardnerella vaginalis JCP8481A]
MNTHSKNAKFATLHSSTTNNKYKQHIQTKKKLSNQINKK